MNGQTIILRPHTRQIAASLIASAPDGHVVNVREPKRTLDQNALLWAVLSDISRAAPHGRKHPPETWKNLFLHACGYEVQFEMGLNGQPFPTGYRSSKLTKAQFSELIEFIYAWCAENDVPLSQREVTA